MLENGLSWIRATDAIVANTNTQINYVWRQSDCFLQFTAALSHIYVSKIQQLRAGSRTRSGKKKQVKQLKHSWKQ